MARRGKPDPLQALLGSVGERVPARCRHFGTCGGCDLQDLPYEVQPALKRRLIEQALADAGVAAEVAATVPALDPWRYRNKIEASFAAADGRVIVGFGPKGRWYDRFDLQECPIAPEWMTRAVEIARQWAREAGAPAYDQRTQQGFLRYLALREGRTTGARIVNLVTAAGDFDPGGFARAMAEVRPSAALRFAQDRPCGSEGHPEWCRGAVVRTLHTGPSAAVRFERVEVLAGEPRFEEKVAGLALSLSLDSFFQTNTLMAERMYEHVREVAQVSSPLMGEDQGGGAHDAGKPDTPPHPGPPPQRGEGTPPGEEAIAPHPNPPPRWGEGTVAMGRVLDLYCGVGSIGLLLAPDAESVLGVEEVEAAVVRARENARRNGISNAEFICARAEKFAVEAGRYDLAVLDPPRAGCSKRVLRHLAEAGVPRMIYVSCSPASLARDLAYLGEWYAIGTIQPFDLFPQTRHVEAVVELKRQ